MSLIFLMIGILIVIVAICLIFSYANKKANERTCFECGTRINDNDLKQCPNCGNPLKANKNEKKIFLKINITTLVLGSILILFGCFITIIFKIRLGISIFISLIGIILLILSFIKRVN